MDTKVSNHESDEATDLTDFSTVVHGRPLGIHQEVPLVPIGINRCHVARGIQLRHLFGSQVPAGCAEVVFELRFVAGADNHGTHRRALQEPVYRDLRKVLPVSAAISSRASTTRYTSSSGTGGPISAVLWSRLCAGRG